MLRKIFTFTAIAVLISGCDQADIDRINDAIAHWDLSHLHELFPQDSQNQDGDVFDDADIKEPQQDIKQDTDVKTSDLLNPDDSDVEHPPVSHIYLIVYQDDLKQAAMNYAEYRRSSGFAVEAVSVSELVSGGLQHNSLVVPIHEKVSSLLRSIASVGDTFLLLIGDAPAKGEENAGKIPAVECTNDTIGQTGCWTDNTYGDLDGDLVPDIAVGRIPATTVQQVEAYLTKVKAHESTYEVGEWNRRVSIYTGEANFDPTIDELLEYAMFEGLKEVSHDFDIIGAYDNVNSKYYYTPFEDKVIDLFNQGNLMTIYVGHGSEEWTQGLTADQIEQISCDHREAIVFFFACYAGNYTKATNSLAETLVWHTRGAVATIGSTDVSHPYGNAVLAYEVPKAALDGRAPTIGEVLMRAKQQMVENQHDDFRQFMAAAAEVALPEMDDYTPLSTIEFQHCNLYNLMGDPALKMNYPPAQIWLPKPVEYSTHGQISFVGDTPEIDSGTAFVTVEVERDFWVGDLVEPENDQDIRDNWAVANNKVMASTTVPIVDGKFTAQLQWDHEKIKGARWIKVYVTDKMGSLPATVDGNKSTSVRFVAQ